ncbi:hypothetical protein T440DRAFT_546662 [Plenodomus tracheiphilus IPT5]|uniref:Uncharacterized protein n=1 Tax=Plenodomus tracheiphilus IPT5 TaxID=1408161 RepID=A0A6A7AQ99_9PLEO|nr:hypothetical protein T440DRAFT_546662 [Plenodomus tracheiphilus IPT5]
MQSRVPRSFSMPLTTLFQSRSAQRASDETANLSDNIKTNFDNMVATTSTRTNHHKRNSSGRVAAGHYCDRPSQRISHHITRVTAHTTSSADQVASTTASSRYTPPSTASSAPLASCESLVCAVSQPAVAPPKVNKANARGVLENPDHTAINTSPSSPLQHLSQHELAMAAYARAEEILAHRHAGLKAQPDSGKEPKQRSAVIVKQATADGTAKVKKMRTKDTANFAPATAPSRCTEIQRQPRTAGDAVAVMQRRERVMKMVYSAICGSDDAQEKLDRLNAHYGEQDNGTKSLQADIIIGFGDCHFRANEFGEFEHIWISRYNALCILRQKLDARIIANADYDNIKDHLFPDENTRPLTPEYFEMFLEPLAEEDVLTKEQAIAIGGLGVTQQELDSGYEFTPVLNVPDMLARQAQNSKPFRMPERKMRTSSADVTDSSKPDDNLLWYLRVLVQAAVYKQPYYRGFFFGNDAAATLNNFYQAHKLSQQDKLLPPTLTKFNRPWTYSETRMLERGQLLCNMLKQYEAGTITDFGVLRIVRATLVHVPGQPRFHRTGLEQMLYDRAVGAGIPMSRIPTILSLLPENDNAFACPTMREELLGAMNVTAAAFEVEDSVRLAEIAADQKAYKKMMNKELGIWGRVKRKAKGVFGKKKVVLNTFNPFSPEHGSCVPAGKEDGSFY